MVLTVILLTLVLVHRRDNLRATEEGVVLALVPQHVVDQTLLSRIRGQDGDLARWITQ